MFYFVLGTRESNAKTGCATESAFGSNNGCKRLRQSSSLLEGQPVKSCGVTVLFLLVAELPGGWGGEAKSLSQEILQNHGFKGARVLKSRPVV